MNQRSDSTPELEPEDDEMFQRRERTERRPMGVSDFVRRAFENTVGQVQNTGSVPREALAFLLQQGDRGRREIVRVVAKEFGDFLRHTDISSEVVKVLTAVQVEVSASVRFKPTGDGRGVVPDVGTSASLSVADEPAADDPPGEEQKS